MTDPSEPLAPEDAILLTDFARACKAAARAVTLYPPAHPTITATLGRIAMATSPPALTDPLQITVLPNALLLDGRAPARPDPALGELAALLHDRLIGELTIHPEGDVEAWRSFLLLLGRSPESIRADGGISRLWTTMGGRHIELREIDYAEVLRERAGGHAADWSLVVASCLQGDSVGFDADALRQLMDMAAREAQELGQVMSDLELRARQTGRAKAPIAALLRMLKGLSDVVAKTDPQRIEVVLRNMAGAVAQISPALMVELLAHGRRDGHRTPQAESRIVDEVVRRMSDETIARFVAKSVVSESSATGRLAEAFRALVPDGDHQQRVLTVAHDEVLRSPIGQQVGFETLWDGVMNMLTSYSDARFVPDEYGRELTHVRTQAMDVERVADDPPDRLTAWLSTVATSAIRLLDLTLLLDLLRIEDDPARWQDLMSPVVEHVQDLVLVGDFDAAGQLVAVIVQETSHEKSGLRATAASTAIDQLVAGPMMRHIASHLPTIDDAQFEQVRLFALAIGTTLVRPLAEALSIEERGRARARLTALLLAFGATGRQTVERLRNSPNPAVRRTAIYLLREFGGTDALPDLTLLLDDAEPQVQREAILAILNIGTDAAYAVLQQALASGTAHSRDAIMQAIASIRDGRATPLLAYIIEHLSHRGPLRPIYVRAIESLGALKDPEGIRALKTALSRGEWWAPRRTADLRAAAAGALGRIGTPDAIAVLREAAASGTRGVRAAARPRLAQAVTSQVGAGRRRNG